MIEIRPYNSDDWQTLWPILKVTFRQGDTYSFSDDICEDEAHTAWITAPKQVYVALDKRKNILGTYYIKPNQPGLGSHVCNCGYIVDPDARGKGVASAMCMHSQQEAVKYGFKAMQYNLVVSTNTGAIRLWEKMGFKIVGTLPKAFNSKIHGFVDAHVMYKLLG